jgi:hypothetical protein
MNPMKILAITALTAALSSTLTACPLIEQLVSQIHTITVRNYCVGADTTVNFYLDGGFKGTVTEARTFAGVLEGTHDLRAEGTGLGGTVFQRTQSITSDGVWTLCSGRSKPEDDSFGSALNTQSAPQQCGLRKSSSQQCTEKRW